MYKTLTSIFLFSFSSFIFSQDCNSQVCLTLDGNNLNYESSADIGGFQFSHDGCVAGASGGDAAASGFTISASGSTVLAFSFTGSVVPSGSGTLVVLDGDVAEDCLSGFIFSDAAGSALSSAWAGSANDISGCTDALACNFNILASDNDGSCR